MRAFLLAKATTAFCQPTRSLSCTSHWLMGSFRLWAVITADLAPASKGRTSSAVSHFRAETNGFSTVTPKCLKSATLRVTTVNLCTFAVAAIIASS